MIEKFLDIITIIDNQIVSESDIQAMINAGTSGMATQTWVTQQVSNAVNGLASQTWVTTQINNKTSNFLTESEINSLLLDLDENLQNQLDEHTDDLHRLEQIIETDIPEDYVSKAHLNSILDEALTYLNNKYS